MSRFNVYLGLFTIYAVVGCSSCATLTGQLPPQVVAEKRAEVIERDIAWLGDTIPILRIGVPFMYGYFRLQLEQCSGLTRDGWPRFYQAPINPIMTGDGPSAAFYDPEANVIVFALGTLTDRTVILHEMLHFLLKPQIPDAPHGETREQKDLRVHPPKYFTEKCGHVINPPAQKG